MKRKLYTKIVLFLFLTVLGCVNAIGQTSSVYPIGTRNITLPKGNTYTADTLGIVSTTSELGTYGGWLDKNVGATGFFHTKEIDSVWYMVDPEGYLFYTVGVTSVVPGGDIELPSALKDWGLNIMGNWSDETIEDFPFVPRFSFLSGFKGTNSYRKNLFNQDIFPVFDADFASWVDTKAEAFVADYKDNSWVVGYQTDNELRLHYTDINSYLALDTSDLHYKAAYDWMMAEHGFVSPVSDDDVSKFGAYVAETYMSTVNTALKKYDPNHMNLGCRIHAAVKYDSLLVKAICKNVDINTINFYGAWEPSEADMDMWINAGKPFMITEFYTKAQDSGLGNEDGAGWEVYTQQDRVDHFENFGMTCLSHRGSVGWTWFKYIDKNDANKGLVNLEYEVYTDLVESMANLSKDVYNLRSYLLNMEPTVDVSNVYISPTALDLTVDDTSILNAIVIPTDATNKLVNWSSNAPSVVSVNDTGLVIARSEGSAKITVTTDDGNMTAYCIVSVTESLTGIGYSNQQMLPELYPVPVKNTLNLSIPKGEYSQYKLYSIEGQLIVDGAINSEKMSVNVSSFQQGIYFITFVSESNTYSSKFIKQ